MIFKLSKTSIVEGSVIRVELIQLGRRQNFQFTYKKTKKKSVDKLIESSKIKTFLVNSRNHMKKFAYFHKNELSLLQCTNAFISIYILLHNCTEQHLFLVKKKNLKKKKKPIFFLCIWENYKNKKIWHFS